jgi:hypothetical protein
MILSKQEDTGNLKRKNYITFYEENALDEALDIL